jgi:hypothetical protein
MKKTLIFFIVLILFCLFYSCRKNSTYDLKPNVNVANDVILSVSSFTAIFNLLIKARLDPSLASHGYTHIDGANINYDSVKREYDFGFGSTISPDSVQRTGTVKVVVSGDILQKGSYAKVSFQNYYEDSGKVDGIDSIANEGANVFSQMVFSVYVFQGTINKVYGGGTITYDMNGKYKTTASSLVPGEDILFLMQGSISGISSKGHTFSASIRDTLQNVFSCPWIKDGIIDVHLPDAQVPDGYIDFISTDGCSDVIWYYFEGSDFKVRKNKMYLKN